METSATRGVMPDKVIMAWTDWHGREVSREIRLTLDIRNFEGMAGYALLFMAANPHLSYDEMLRFLASKGVGRTLSWLRRRRWMFQQPDSGAKPDVDGNGTRATQIMRANPTMSVAKLSRLLAGHGIKRSREWVRRNRCR